MSWTLAQTEKSFKLEPMSVFTLGNLDRNYKTNKIELGKNLKKLGLTALKITSTKSYLKQKKRNGKKNTFSQFRAKKWYVTLESGQTLSQELLKELK